MIYSELLDLIKQCEGAFATIIKDHDILNRFALNSIKKSLSSEYKIFEFEYSENMIDKYICNSKEKTIIFVKCDKLVNRRLLNRNDNLIIVFIKRFYNIINSTPNYTNYTNYTNDMNVIYMSNIVFLLKDKEIKIVKNRYSNINDTMDMNNFSRKKKLQNINKISDKQKSN
jgi:hypothetical protein